MRSLKRVAHLPGKDRKGMLKDLKEMSKRCRASTNSQSFKEVVSGSLIHSINSSSFVTSDWEN